jgi:phosphopantothenoylcysteine decarboxylase/phosphopantothenate--cysteine ligase
MTASATQFITPVTMQALSGQTVYTDAWDSRIPNNMPHIDLTRDADAILIAPCSTNFMAKLANGLCDDLLSTLCIARPANLPLLIAPAMNVEMWQKRGNSTERCHSAPGWPAAARPCCRCASLW